MDSKNHISPSPPNLRTLATAIFCVWSVLFFTACEKKQVRIGDPLPELGVVDLQDNTKKLKDYNDSKALIIVFWQDACCSDQLPLLNTLYQKYRDKGLTILGVNLNDTKEKVGRVVSTLHIDFPNVLDQMLITSKRYQVYGLPTYFIAGKNRVILDRIVGNVPIDHLEKKILPQLNTP